MRVSLRTLTLLTLALAASCARGSAEPSAPMVDSIADAAANVVDAGDSASDAVAIEATAPVDAGRWCETQTAILGRKLCADFDDGTWDSAHPSVGPQGMAPVIDSLAVVSPPSAVLFATPWALAADAGPPAGGGAVAEGSHSALTGSTEGTIRYSRFEFSFRIERASSPPGTPAKPPALGWLYMAYFTPIVTAMPSASGVELGLRIQNTWSGPIPAGAAHGGNQNVITDHPLPTAHVPIGEWIQIVVETRFTKLPTNDSSADVEVTLSRAGTTLTMLTYHEPSTRHDALTLWHLGITEIVFPMSPLEVRYDNMAVYVQ